MTLLNDSSPPHNYLPPFWSVPRNMRVVLLTQNMHALSLVYDQRNTVIFGTFLRKKVFSIKLRLNH